LLAQLTQEFGISYFTVEASSPAGQRLAHVSGLPRQPGIYLDLRLVSFGMPVEADLRRALEDYLMLV
jgi:hypothetical protein